MASYYSSTGDNIWTTWTTTSASTSTTNDIVWRVWSGEDEYATTSTTSASTAYTSSDVWYTWTDHTTNSLDNHTQDPQVSQIIWRRWSEDAERQFTRTIQGNAERNEEEQRRIAESVRQQEEAHRIRAEAEEKAKQLLLDLIGEEQMEVYNRTGRVLVKGKKNDYIIQKEGFIRAVSKGKVTDLCAHLGNRHAYPDEDNVVAMKLFIEANEEEFLNLANKHGTRDMDQLPECACM